MAISVTIICGPATAGREVDGVIQVANVGSTTANITGAQLSDITGAVSTIRQPAIVTPIVAGGVANFPFAFVCQGPVSAGPPSQNVGANHSNPWGGSIITLQCTVSGTDGSGAVSDTAQCNVAVGALQAPFPSLGGALQFNATGNSPNFIFF